MATFLLDTNTFSFLMKQHLRVVAHAASVLPPNELATCAIVRGEIEFGLRRMSPGRRRRHLEATAANLFAGLPYLPMAEAAGDAYARLKRRGEQAGLPLDENDLWIAATAIACGAILVTADRDFSRVSGLRVEDWTV